VVALNDRRHRAEPPDGGAIQIPDGLGNERVMRVDNVGHVVLVAREVKLNDTIGWDALDGSMRVVLMIEAAEEYVVNVEDEPTARALRKLRDEFPLRHFRM